MVKTKFSGVGVALITPFHEDESIDFESLKKILEHTAQPGGPDYYVVMGTTGESPTLSDDEKQQVLSFVKKHNTKQLPIMFGIGGNDTRHVLETIKKTDFAGVDGILSVAPYYNKPSQEGYIRHYTAIADACPVPVMMYNIPGRTGSNMTAATTLKLAQHQNIIGVKEASGDLMQMIEILAHKPNDFILTAGDDLLAVPICYLGGMGSIAVLANIFPKSFTEMVHAAMDGNREKANGLLHSFLGINPLLYAEGNPVGAKAAMQSMGLCKAFVRMPLATASAELSQKISSELKKMQ